jgi:hypothetical protein
LCVFKAFSHSLILFRVKLRVRLRVNVRVSAKVRVRAKVKLELGLGSTKEEVQCTLNMVLFPSPSLFQNHVLTGVTSFEVYVNGVIGRRFEKVKNGHIFD